MSPSRTAPRPLPRLALCLLATVAAASCGGGGDSGAVGSFATAGTASTVAVADPATSAGNAATTPVAAVTATTTVPVVAVLPEPTTGTPAVSAAPPVATVAPLSTTIAAEGAAFTVAGTQSVSYGAASAWVAKEVSGRGACTNAFFGTDPIPGVVKSCQVATAALAGASSAAATTSGASTPAGTRLPAVDAGRIPAAALGHATARVAPANVADPSQNPVAGDIGAFREYCEYSHMSTDDPIVAPGSTGGHLHTFMGNTGTDRHSTATSLSTTGNSTCAGGTLNRTAYWFPSMIDTRDGTPLAPKGSLVYYKQGYNYIASAAIRAFPAGLRMIAGSAASTGAQNGLANFTCYRPDGTWSTSAAIPSVCPAGSTLTMAVNFPQCWDGVNLDSPDHQSHLAYPVIGCPATHPVPLPAVSFNINYGVGETNATARWRLSSDNYDPALPGGYSAHADWYDGWSRDILATWTTRCLNASMDCHAFLIGDGRILY